MKLVLDGSPEAIYEIIDLLEGAFENKTIKEPVEVKIRHEDGDDA